jgi:phage gp16-like protein
MSRRAQDAAQLRKRVLGAIHAMRRELEVKQGMVEDSYRDLIQRVSAEHGPAHRSAGDCNRAQLNAVANEMRRLLGQPVQAAERAKQWAGRPKGDLSPQVAKIEALLADAGREWAYAHSLAERICKVPRVEWCSADQLSKLIAALQIDADRRKKRSTP